MPRLEHIGIAVKDAPAVAQLYQTLLGAGPYKAETVAREGVRTHFIAAGTAKLELLEALGPDSPVAKYLDKRGAGLHHLAFEVDDAAATLARLRDAGFQPLSDEPRPGADGKHIFFLHPKQTHGVLVEFCQSVPTPFERHRVPYAGDPIEGFARGTRTHPALLLLTEAAFEAPTERLARRLETHFHVLGLDAATASAPHIAAFLDAFSVGQTHVFGQGAGGTAALRFARTHPGRVQRLALHDTALAETDAMAFTGPTLVSAGDQHDHAALAGLLALRDRVPHVRLALLPGPSLLLDAYLPLLRCHLGV